MSHIPRSQHLYTHCLRSQCGRIYWHLGTILVHSWHYKILIIERLPIIWKILWGTWRFNQILLLMIQLVRDNKHRSGIGQQFTRSNDIFLFKTERIWSVNRIQQNLKFDVSTGIVEVLGNNTTSCWMPHEYKSVLQICNHPWHSIVEHQLNVFVEPFYDNLENMSYLLRIGTL